MLATEFDEWRRDYDKLSYVEQQEFYNRAADDHPSQSHFSPDELKKFFEKWIVFSRVFELGGWDGEAAGLVLAAHPHIRCWDNYEICTVVPDVCSDPRYRRITGGCFPWERDLSEYDCWVLSHVVEHLSHAHLEALLGAGEPEYVYVDIPLSDNWWGSTAAHKLQTDANGLDAVFSHHGLHVVEAGHGKKSDSVIRVYERGV